MAFFPAFMAALGALILQVSTVVLLGMLGILLLYGICRPIAPLVCSDVKPYTWQHGRRRSFVDGPLQVLVAIPFIAVLLFSLASLLAPDKTPNARAATEKAHQGGQSQSFWEKVEGRR
jgi:hypothetical protein